MEVHRTAELQGDALILLTPACVHVHGGPAPVRKHLPHPVDLIMKNETDPGKVFDLEVSLENIAAGYAAMDERRAIKTLVRL